MSVAVSQHKNFVGGEWVDSAGGETMEVLNPSTGEVIAEVARSTAEDADRAALRAQQTEQMFDEGRFAGAVGADEAIDAASRQRQTH